VRKPKVKFNHGRKFYSFNTRGLKKLFPGTKFVREIAYDGLDCPVAIFHQPNPDVSKGHKEYFGLYQSRDKMMVVGFTTQEIQKMAFHAAVHCKNCNEVIYSRYRHDHRSCGCESVSVDGGKDYTKVSGDREDYVMVTADVINEVVIEYTKLNRVLKG
jgi:hypothetical protein